MSALEAQRLAVIQVKKLRETAAQFVALIREIKERDAELRRAMESLSPAASKEVDRALDEISTEMAGAITEGCTWRVQP